jgi:3-methyladenine DNA glycosylase AlkD
MGFFGSLFGSKEKMNDATIGEAIRLGIPEPDARQILNTQMEEIAKLLAYTILPQSTVKHLKVHERAAHCIKIIYNRDS